MLVSSLPGYTSWDVESYIWLADSNSIQNEISLSCETIGQAKTKLEKTGNYHEGVQNDS